MWAVKWEYAYAPGHPHYADCESEVDAVTLAGLLFGASFVCDASFWELPGDDTREAGGKAE